MYLHACMHVCVCVCVCVPMRVCDVPSPPSSSPPPLKRGAEILK
jgi:hypothetical protein